LIVALVRGYKRLFVKQQIFIFYENTLLSYKKITFLNSLKRWQMGKIAVFLRESLNARFGVGQ